MANVKKRIGRSKVEFLWRGPFILSDWVFEVEDLHRTEIHIVYAQRLRFYSDKTLNVTEELLSYVENTEDTYQVDKLIDIRTSERSYDVLVHWLGFSESERTWEPIEQLFEDVPLTLKSFLEEKEMEHIFDELHM